MLSRPRFSREPDYLDASIAEARASGGATASVAAPISLRSRVPLYGNERLSKLTVPPHGGTLYTHLSASFRSARLAQSQSFHAHDRRATESTMETSHAVFQQLAIKSLQRFRYTGDVSRHTGPHNRFGRRGVMHMALDPDIATMLKSLESAPPMESLSVEALREGLAYPPLDRRTVVSETVDFDIPLEGRVLAARLYRPVERKSDGVSVFFHGGGFVIGNLDTHDHVCRDLCAGSGAAVIAVDYRLAPEHRFPAAVNDCFDAVCWIAQHAHLLSLDASRMVVAGDSAGGNLAAVTALRIRDEGGPSLCAQVLVYPVTDYHTPPTRSYVENQSGYVLTRAAMVRFWRHYVENERDAFHPHACPLRAKSLAGLPRALVVTAGFDPLRDEGDAYANRLFDAGVPVTLRHYEGMIHGFFRMGVACAAAQEALMAAAAWISDAMAR
ncbi:alpha/beta hydrolase [Burkholderia multivorans]|uniref:alpha/beta hydrolase n=1 Tax=Burkholderia multivorans TaxID=87883 RepID=UPI002870942D|nr:alpha/beta hydrolase [Burkholderia multivorans]